VTGKVKEVEVYADGVIVHTEEGKKVLLQAGVVFSDNPISIDTETDDKTSSDSSASDDSST
jgi:flagellar basal-body rod modification protein FlgD